MGRVLCSQLHTSQVSAGESPSEASAGMSPSADDRAGPLAHGALSPGWESGSISRVGVNAGKEHQLIQLGHLW